MSTPERQQDPGEHGYGGTKQDYPADGGELEPESTSSRERPGDEDHEVAEDKEGLDETDHEAP